MMLAFVQRLICHGTPLALWRTTNASTPIAATVSMVSRRLSPLLTLDVPTLNVMTSADSRLAAVSNDSRVRVESSKNRLHTVLPRSAGTFGFGPLVDLDHRVGEVEQAADGRRGRPRRSSGGASRKITRAARRRRRRSPPRRGRPAPPRRARSGRFLPTKSGRIGSSRWPRSTITASCTACGRPYSATASRAARTVRPVNSTSSTRTTVAPSRLIGMSLRPAGTTGRRPMSSRYSEASIDADRHRALDAADLGRQPLGQPDPTRPDPEQHDAVEAAVALQDLVGHAGRRPPHVLSRQDPLGIRRTPSWPPAAAQALPRSLLRPGLTGPASRSSARVAAAPAGRAASFARSKTRSAHISGSSAGRHALGHDDVLLVEQDPRRGRRRRGRASISRCASPTCWRSMTRYSMVGGIGQPVRVVVAPVRRPGTGSASRRSARGARGAATARRSP